MIYNSAALASRPTELMTADKNCKLGSCVNGGAKLSHLAGGLKLYHCNLKPVIISGKTSIKRVLQSNFTGDYRSVQRHGSVDRVTG